MLLLLVASVAPDPAQAACALSEAQRGWLQATLDGWTSLTDDLGRDPDRLPWMVVFDDRCAWHLGADASRLAGAEHVTAGLSLRGEAVAVLALEHHEVVRLPDGREIAPAPLAFTALYGDRPFFVTALPDVWRATPGIEQVGDVDAFARGIVAHEMTHTLHLSAIANRLHALGDRWALPEAMDDDIVEARFGEDSAFVAELDAERALYRAAVQQRDPERKRALVVQALNRTRARQARFFTGPNEVFAEIEETFLGMEGAAILAHHRLHERTPELVSFVRSSGHIPWSQEFGYTLFQLVDQLVPDWPDRVFCPRPDGPFTLLEGAVGLAEPHASMGTSGG